MKRLILVAMVAAVAVAFTGCQKKEPTLADSVNKAAKSTEKAAQKATADAEKTAADLNKKLDGALKK
jgi:PBP1b-binding outer membrane lipoprotein LpoB